MSEVTMSQVADFGGSGEGGQPVPNPTLVTLSFLVTLSLSIILTLQISKFEVE